MPQPVAINDNGVMLSVGLLSNGDRWEIVMPLCYDHALGAIDAEHICQDAVSSFFAGPFNDLLACLSADTQITFLSAEGMTDGRVPQRVDFAIGANAGSRPAGAMPSNVTALITYYEEPADVAPNTRMRTGKTFLSGIAQSDVAGDHVITALVTLMTTFGADMLLGYASTLVPATKWYRYLSSPLARAAGTNVKRVGVVSARAYVATQRRRLIPR